MNGGMEVSQRKKKVQELNTFFNNIMESERLCEERRKGLRLTVLQKMCDVQLQQLQRKSIKLMSQTMKIR